MDIVFEGRRYKSERRDYDEWGVRDYYPVRNSEEQKQFELQKTEECRSILQYAERADKRK